MQATGRKRLILSVTVLAAGIALVIYGAIFHSVVVFEKGAAPDEVGVSGDKTETLSELAITLEATREGVTRLETGKIQSTRAAGETPAAFCPT